MDEFSDKIDFNALKKEKCYEKENNCDISNVFITDFTAEYHDFCKTTKQG